MTFESLTPMLETSDMKLTIAFYTEVLSFEIHNVSEDLSWAALGKDGISIMFSIHNAHRGFTKSVLSGSLYFRVDELEKLWEVVKDKSSISYPIEDFPYGMREFAIVDPNGYLLQFGKEIS